MVTCNSCSRDALYEYRLSSDYAFHYCQAHLPNFLYGKTGQILAKEIVVAEAPLPTVVEVEPPVVESKVTPLVSKKNRKAQPVVPVFEEPAVVEEPVEEPVVEGAPVEEAPVADGDN